MMGKAGQGHGERHRGEGSNTGFKHTGDTGEKAHGGRDTGRSTVFFEVQIENDSFPFRLSPNSPHANQ